MTDTQDNCCPKQNNQLANPGCCVIEIRIRGQLGPEWSDWFENLDIRTFENGETVLSGPIVDQSALMGILNRLSRLNLSLISVNEVRHSNDASGGEGNGTTADIKSQT